MCQHSNFTCTYCGANVCVLNVKALVGTFNQMKALVGAFSVNIKLRVIFGNLRLKLYSSEVSEYCKTRLGVSPVPRPPSHQVSSTTPTHQDTAATPPVPALFRPPGMQDR